MLIGFRSDSELLEILSDIGDDLKTDVKLDNNALGNYIMTHPIAFNTGYDPSLKETLTMKYFKTGTSTPTKTKTVKYDANQQQFFIVLTVQSDIKKGHGIN